jgi:hypothetical protein
MHFFGLVGQTEEAIWLEAQPERPCFICYNIPNLNNFIPFVAVIFTIICCFQIIILFVQCVKYLGGFFLLFSRDAAKNHALLLIFHFLLIKLNI